MSRPRYRRGPWVERGSAKAAFALVVGLVLAAVALAGTAVAFIYDGFFG